jgi:peptidoglycan hydrolase-like protein with peptidoglycan-binding domain
MFKNVLLLVSISLLMAVGIFAQNSTGAATAATTASKPARFTPTKDQIMQGQKLLKDKKLYDGEASGVYTDPTRAAIRAYQKDNGLTVSGNFNQATLEKMNIALTDRQKGVPAAPATEAKSATSSTGSASGSTAKQIATGSQDTAGKKPAPFRANVDQIKAAQKILRDGKMLTGGEDGKLDDPTREGLGKYQDANTLKVTKTLNATTLEKMGIALTDGQKANVAAQAAYDAAAKKN